MRESAPMPEPAPVHESAAAPGPDAAPFAASGGGEAHRPVAHFEPAPPLEGAGRQGKPYVVWSSAPSESARPEPGGDEGG